MTDSLYKEGILDHYKNPLHFGILDNYDSSSKQLNPFCGDEIEIFIKEKNDKIQAISFTGKGCAISIASASILSEYAKGRSKQKLTKFSEEDMLNLLEIEVSETRKKCALLALAVLRDCIA